MSDLGGKPTGGSWIWFRQKLTMLLVASRQGERALTSGNLANVPSIREARYGAVGEGFCRFKISAVKADNNLVCGHSKIPCPKTELAPTLRSNVHSALIYWHVFIITVERL